MALRFYAPDERSGSADASKRLSERFGIPEQEVRKLLYGSGSSAAPTPPPPTPPPTPPVIQPPVIMPQPEHHWNPVSTLGALLGVIGILALAAAIVIIMRVQHHEPPMIVDMPPRHEMPAPAAEPPPPSAMPKDSCCQPSTAVTDKPTETAPAEEPKQEKPTVSKPAHHKVKTSSAAAYRTSNSMEAEEKLAELRADGHSKAKIRTITKNGVTLYEVK